MDHERPVGGRIPSRNSATGFFVQPEHGHVKVGSQTFTGFINLNIIKEIEANQDL